MDSHQEDPLDRAIRTLAEHGMVAFRPRLTPDERAAEALRLLEGIAEEIEQLAFELITLEDATRMGAVLTEDQKRKLRSIGNRMVRRAE